MPEMFPSPLRTELEEVLLVAAGAVPGALLRWQVAQAFQDHNLLVNLAGAALLGFLTGLPFASRRQLLLGIGFCGSATTFSSWMISIVQLMMASSYLRAFGLLLATLFCGVGAAGLGFLCGQQVRI